MRKIILYIAISQDGYIADKHGGVDWLPHPKDEVELKAFGYKELMSNIDTIMMGSYSYKQIERFGEWGWPDKQTFVFTSKPFESLKSYILYTSEKPSHLVEQLKKTPGKNIWLLGGAKLAQSFAKDKLIDEIILTLIPKTLGEGIFLGIDLKDFELSSEEILMNGILQRKYVRSSC